MDRKACLRVIVSLFWKQNGRHITSLMPIRRVIISKRPYISLIIVCSSSKYEKLLVRNHGLWIFRRTSCGFSILLTIEVVPKIFPNLNVVGSFSCTCGLGFLPAEAGYFLLNELFEAQKWKEMKPHPFCVNVTGNVFNLWLSFFCIYLFNFFFFFCFFFFEVLQNYFSFVPVFKQDSAFSWDDFMTKNNSELLNNLGNFINRCVPLPPPHTHTHTHTLYQLNWFATVPQWVTHSPKLFYCIK